jgi:hypothetical protein
MDDESKFYALIGRALMDPEYRDQILDTGQQAAALAKVGIEANEAVLEKLNESIDAIRTLASPEGFGEIAAVT